MKRITFIIKITSNFGGAERRFARLINYLSKEPNLKISVILVGHSNHVDNFVVEYFNNDLINILKTNTIFKVRRLIKQTSPDILHFVTVNISLMLIYIYLNIFSHRYTVILSLNSYDLCLGNYKNGLQKKSFYTLLKSVNQLDCLYPSKINDLKNTINNLSLKRKIEITYPNSSFTDLEKFKQKHQKQNYIIFASRLIKQKNPELALQAIYECRTVIRDKNYKVYFAGDGPLYTVIEEYIKLNEIEDIVLLTGNIDLSDILSKSKIFLSLQEIENYPSQSLLEAISSGNYIIASDVGDTKRIVKKDFGRLIRLNVDILAKSLIEAIEVTSHKEKMDIISTKTRDFAIKNFQISSYAKHIKNIWIK